MAATTLSEIIKLMGDYVSRELLTEQFLTPDPVFARIPWLPTPGGLSYTQRYLESRQTASGMAIRDAFSLSGLATGKYTSLVSLIGAADDDADLSTAAGPGQQGIDPRIQKRNGLLAAVSNKARAAMVSGDEASYAIGSNLTTLGITDIEPAMAGSLFAYEDIHDSSGVQTKNIALKWSSASKQLQIRIGDDSAYGPAVTLSATKYHRVPLYSGGSSGSQNTAKACYVTVNWSTISAAADFDSDSGGTPADYVVATPTKLPNGFLRKVNPEHRIFTDLSSDDNPPAAGGPLDQANLTWLTQKLLNVSNDRPAQCAIIVDPLMWISASAVINALGQKAQLTRFLGTEIMTLSFGGIPILQSPNMPTNITSPDGSKSNLRRVLGLVFGEDACHIKYMDLGGANPLAGKVLASRNVLTDSAGSQSLPIAYLERDADPTKLVTYQQALIAMDPAVGRLDAVAMIDNVTA